jgi:HK97 family phage prohead protease
MTTQQRAINAEREEAGVIIKAEATERGTTRFIASTPTPDSYNDIIVQSGWKLDRFLKNPVIPWAHSRWDLPVGKSIDTQVTDQALVIEVEWAPHEFAQDVKRLYDEEFLNAVSVGFRPLKWQYLDNGGVLFQEAELLEVSAVPIPANPDALAIRQGDRRARCVGR